VVACAEDEAVRTSVAGGYPRAAAYSFADCCPTACWRG